MNWDASETKEQESDKFKRWIKESIHIRTNTPTMPEQGRGRIPAITYLDQGDFHPQLLTSVTFLVVIRYGC